LTKVRDWGPVWANPGDRAANDKAAVYATILNMPILLSLEFADELS
jgi:hypothetical protein